MTKTEQPSASAPLTDYTKPFDRALDIKSFLLAKDPALSLDDAATIAAFNAKFPVAPWHNERFRVSPNVLLRCGLFRVAQSRAEREQLIGHRYPLQASRGGHIEYTGEELRQDDCDVFMSLLQAEQATPGVALIKPTAVTVALGWGRSSAAVGKLERSVIRMGACQVDISVNQTAGGKGKVLPSKTTLSLVDGHKKTKDGVWVVYLPGKIQSLCADNHYSKILKEDLDKLNKGAALASWLLKFYSTHRAPMPIKLADLKKYCGSVAVPKEFKRMVAEALEHLKEIGFLESYRVGEIDVGVLRRALDKCGGSEGT